jgi:diguanylate cyclase (GGDEF)-like protein
MTVFQRIFWTTFGTAAIAVITFVVLLFWITSKVNEIAAEETKERVTHTLEHLMEHNALLTMDYAHWNSAFEWFEARNIDQLYENLGSGAADSDSFDMIYLLSADGTPQHIYVSDVFESNIDNFVPAIANALVAKVMAQPLSPYGTVSAFVLVDGEIAIVTGARIQPNDVTGHFPADLPVMIGGLWLDPSYFAQALSMGDVWFTVPDIALAPEHQSLALLGQGGVTLGYLTWIAPLPGQALLIKVAPAVVLLATLLMVGAWIVARFSATQADAYLRERISARTDPMTGLLNRTGITEVIKDAKVEALCARLGVAVIYVDLNGLKALNDTYGHKFGDLAIRITAKRLQTAMNEKGYIARMGGDEFVCLITDSRPGEAAANISERFLNLMDQMIELSQTTFTVSASIGIALSQTGVDWETLLSQADDAMYQAKRSQRSDPVFFSTESITAD